MKKWFGLTVCTMALVMAAAPKAHALWLAMHVTPGMTAEQGRTIRVQIKNVRGQKECRVVVTPGSKETLPLRPWSSGSLYIIPDGLPDNELPAKRGQSVPVKETRVGSTVTYTFRVPAEQLSRLRFEFHDSRGSSREMPGGGTVYWFNVREWASLQRPAAS